MMSTLWCCCACWLVFHDVYSMVLLCMLAGVVCWLLYGVAVHVRRAVDEEERDSRRTRQLSSNKNPRRTR